MSTEVEALAHRIRQLLELRWRECQACASAIAGGGLGRINGETKISDPQNDMKGFYVEGKPCDSTLALPAAILHNISTGETDELHHSRLPGGSACVGELPKADSVKIEEVVRVPSYCEGIVFDRDGNSYVSHGQVCEQDHP